MASVLIAALLGVATIRASPSLFGRQSITALTTAQINAYTPYAYYASAAYCSPAQTLAWNCGTNCNANLNFKPIASGGNGDSIQYWYVGYDSRFETVIVAHQGTNPSQIDALFTDTNFFLKNLDTTLFPGLSSEIRVHSGFADDQASTATEILAAVQQTISEYGTASVTMVGHSTGAALSLLDSVYLPLWVPAGTPFMTIVFGLPRVGNQAFADYVDNNLHLTHINNEEDPIPTLPSTSLGYVSPSGEVHIEDSGEWAACPGQDNPSTQCIVGDVSYIWDGNINNHNGPYNGVTMGC